MHGAVQTAKSRGEAAELGDAHHEMGYRLGDDGYVQPDVSLTFSGQESEDCEYFEGAPAIAIEVVSPSHTADELSTKTRLYFEHGARDVWRLYQKARYLEVQVASGSRTVLLDEAVTTPLVPAFSMTVREMLGV
jgi:Uma2 family endonuclease